MLKLFYQMSISNRCLNFNAVVQKKSFFFAPRLVGFDKSKYTRWHSTGRVVQTLTCSFSSVGLQIYRFFIYQNRVKSAAIRAAINFSIT